MWFATESTVEDYVSEVTPWPGWSQSDETTFVGSFGADVS